MLCTNNDCACTHKQVVSSLSKKSFEKKSKASRRIQDLPTGASSGLNRLQLLCLVMNWLRK